jgi:preprotein translocase subunit Sec61beta
MAQDKVSMPSSMGGIVRYFDDYKSKLEFKPGHIVIMAVALLIIEIILHSMG